MRHSAKEEWPCRSGPICSARNTTYPGTIGPLCDVAVFESLDLVPVGVIHEPIAEARIVLASSSSWNVSSRRVPTRGCTNSDGLMLLMANATEIPHVRVVDFSLVSQP